MKPCTDETLPSILVIEDNPADLHLIQHALKSAQLTVKVAACADGEVALRAIHAMTGGAAPLPRLVLLDLNLPKVDGFELLRTIRKEDYWRNVPVLILTSSPRTRDMERCRDLGSTGYRCKPENLEDLDRFGAELKDLLADDGRSRAQSPPPTGGSAREPGCR